MHLTGCPCNGFGGCYAKCTCDQIRLRSHTDELSRFNDHMDRMDLPALLDRIIQLEDRVAQLEAKP